jgi:hypothetical protein
MLTRKQWNQLKMLLADGWDYYGVFEGNTRTILVRTIEPTWEFCTLMEDGTIRSGEHPIK